MSLAGLTLCPFLIRNALQDGNSCEVSTSPSGTVEPGVDLGDLVCRLVLEVILCAIFCVLLLREAWTFAPVCVREIEIREKIHFPNIWSHPVPRGYLIVDS